MYSKAEIALYWLLIIVIVIGSIWYVGGCEVVETYDFHAVVYDKSTYRPVRSGYYSSRRYYIYWQDGAESDRERVDSATYHNINVGDLIHISAAVVETPFGGTYTEYQMR